MVGGLITTCFLVVGRDAGVAATLFRLFGAAVGDIESAFDITDVVESFSCVVCANAANFSRVCPVAQSGR